MTTKRFRQIKNLVLFIPTFSKHFLNVPIDGKIILMDCLKGETSEI